MKSITLLGATGSIGENTLKVLRGHRDALRLVGIAANRRWRELAPIAREFGVRDVALHCPLACREAEASGDFAPGTRFHCGDKGLVAVATLPESQLMVSAAVGTVGLRPTLAAIEAGKDIALASKEILVLAGAFVTAAARRKGVRLLPVDSEHNALFQCLGGATDMRGVRRLLLTASGGQFRDLPLPELDRVTPEAAVRHPNWNMGPKVTVDSATMANKGLEVIEARWLFGATAGQIGVVVHPQSIVHSMVEFIDGSIVAHLSPPSMTFPIQHCLFHPDRAAGVVPTLDFASALSLDFRPPDPARYPCLGLAFDALRAGGTAPGVFNAANEVAVDAFLSRRLAFTGIARVVARTLDACPAREPADLADVLAADAEARRIASSLLSKEW